MKKVLFLLLILTGVAFAQVVLKGSGQTLFDTSNDTITIKSKYNVMSLASKNLVVGSIRADSIDVRITVIEVDSSDAIKSDSINVNDAFLVDRFGKLVAAGINSTPIGATTASTGKFTSLSASGDAVLSGNVGIKNAVDASYILKGTGDIYISGVSTLSGGIAMSATSSVSTTYVTSSGFGGAYGDLIIKNRSGYSMLFDNGDGTTMTLFGNKLGIGVTPTAKLDVSTSGSTIGLRVDGNKTTGNLIEVVNDDDGVVATGDSVFTVSSAGLITSAGLTTYGSGLVSAYNVSASNLISGTIMKGIIYSADNQYFNIDSDANGTNFYYWNHHNLTTSGENLMSLSEAPALTLGGKGLSPSLTIGTQKVMTQQADSCMVLKMTSGQPTQLFAGGDGDTYTQSINTDDEVIFTGAAGIQMDAGAYVSADSAHIGPSGSDYMEFGGAKLDVYIDSPVADSKILQLGTSDDADRFAVDENGAVTADGSLTLASYVDADSGDVDHLVVNVNMDVPSGSLSAADVALAQDNILVGNVSGQAEAGTDLPTATTIGAKYIYRADGTDVPDDDVANDITASNYVLLTAVEDSVEANAYHPGGTDVADDDVVDTITAENYLLLTAFDDSLAANPTTEFDYTQVNDSLIFHQNNLGHGMITITDTDNYAHFRANDGSEGGLTVYGFSTGAGGDDSAISLRAVTTETTPSYYPFVFAVGTKTSTTWSGLSAGRHGFLWTNGSSKIMALNTSGWLGVGTEVPAHKLHVDGGNIALGDSTTGDHDGIIYFADDGNCAAESFKYDDGEGKFIASGDLAVEGFSASGDASVGGELAITDSLQVGAGDFIRKTFISADGLSIGFIYYNPVLTRVDTVYAVQPQ